MEWEQSKTFHSSSEKKQKKKSKSFSFKKASGVLPLGGDVGHMWKDNHIHEEKEQEKRAHQGVGEIVSPLSHVQAPAQECIS